MKHSRMVRLGSAVLVLLGLRPALAQATPAAALTLQQAVALALRQNPTLLAAQRNLESTRAEGNYRRAAPEPGLLAERY